MERSTAASASSTEPAVHLEHALLYIRNLDKSLGFYRALFPEWTIRWDGRTEGQPWIHLGPAGEGQPGYLSLYEYPEASESKDLDESLAVQHLGFSHPDVNALVARLASARIEAGDRADDGKFRRAYFTDPDGHELEFVQKL